MSDSVTARLRHWYLSIRRNYLLLGSSYFAANTFAVTSLGVLFWWLAARLYPEESVGLAVVAIATTQLITTTAQLGLGYGVIRFLPEAGSNASELINSALTAAGTLALGLSGLALLTGTYLSSKFGSLTRSNDFSTTFVLLTVALTLFQLLDQMLAALRAGRMLLWKNTLTGCGRVALLAVASVWPTPLAMLIAFGLPLALAVIVTIAFVLPRLVPNYVPRLSLPVRQLVKLGGYSLSSYSGNLLHDLPYQLLPHVIANQIGVASAAYFYMIWNVFGLLTTVSGSVSLSLFVEGSHDLSRLRQFGAHALGLALGVTALMAIAVVLLAKPLLGIFGPAYAANGTQALRILALSALPAGLVYLLVAIQRIRKQLASVNVAFGMIALLSLTLAQYSIERGLYMVGVVWILAQSIAAIYLLFAGQSGSS